VDVGKAISRDISSSERFARARSDEAAEAEIDRFISKRSKMLEIENQERREEAAWAESTRVHNEKRRQQARVEWHLHHTTQAEGLRNTLEDLIAHHEERAEELAELGGGDAA